MGKEIPACQFGFLTLTHHKGKNMVLVKANKITSITVETYEDGIVTYVWMDRDSYTVLETMEEIFKQLESIHPSLR